MAGKKARFSFFLTSWHSLQHPPGWMRGRAPSSPQMFRWSHVGTFLPGSTQEENRLAAYLDGNGDHLVGQVLIQQADGCSQKLHSTGVCFVGIDAIQKLEVHDEDIPLLQETRGNMSKSSQPEMDPRIRTRGRDRQLPDSPVELRIRSSFVLRLKG